MLGRNSSVDTPRVSKKFTNIEGAFAILINENKLINCMTSSSDKTDSREHHEEMIRNCILGNIVVEDITIMITLLKY
jgi:hypothetical protein